MTFAPFRIACRAIAFCALGAASAPGQQPELEFDLLARDPDAGEYFRGFGFDNNGQFGTPVAAGHDVDGDGHADSVLALMTGSPNGLNRAGRVVVFFGDGSVHGEVDGAVRGANVMHIVGSQVQENIGSEVWMGDMTGDGLGEILICRQNYTPGVGRIGAGAVSLVVGSPALRTFAATEAEYAIGAPPGSIRQFTLVGRNEYDRLGIWARLGDVDGDGIEDLVAAADQSDVRGTHSGEIWVIRGGPHLAAATETLDLLDFGSSAFEGNIARIVPPNGAEQHLGSTLHVHDLDGNGRAEIMACVDALNRSGASLRPSGGVAGQTHASSSESRDGAGWIVWDDNFPEAPWPAGFTIALNEPDGSVSRVDGPATYASFGEEVIGGVDFDNDGTSDVLFADLTMEGQKGQAKVLYNAPLLKGATVDLDSAASIPDGVTIVTITGPKEGSIGLDTVLQGDFNGDGIGDLGIGNPQDDPIVGVSPSRPDAGTMHILYGRDGFWPSSINLAEGQLPPSSSVRIARIVGARAGDILCYSAAYGDMDGDGRTDVITNEMTGDGANPAINNNVGTIIIVSGADLLDPPPTAPSGTWMIIE